MRAVFADCHVGRRPGDEGPFLEALDAARQRGPARSRCSATSSTSSSRTRSSRRPAIARFLETVAPPRQAGVAVTYVEGNRDFFLRGSLRRERLRRRSCDEETLRGRRPAVPRDARRPAEREGPPVPLLALPVEERRSRGPPLDFVPKGAGQPPRLERRGAPLPVQLQAQDAAAGRDDPRLRRAALPRRRRRAAARPLPQVLDRRASTAGASRSCRPSSTSGAGWRSRDDGDDLARLPRERGVTRLPRAPAGAVPRAASVRVPPSKSATNRALLARGALTGDPVEIAAPLESDDTAALRRCLEAMGAAIVATAKGLRVRGPLAGAADREIDLDAADSGTAARFLAAAAAAVPGRFCSRARRGSASGRSGSWSTRCAAPGRGSPIAAARAVCRSAIEGGRSRRARSCVDASRSSQFLSALLLAAVAVEGGLRCAPRETSLRPLRRATLEILRAFGHDVEAGRSDPRPAGRDARRALRDARRLLLGRAAARRRRHRGRTR